MVDPPYSDCEKPALKTVKSSDKASDSAVTPISIEGDSAEFGADLRKMSSANSCVPKIVVIDNYGGSHSPCETLNVKDALSTKSKRRDKKTWRKDQDTTRASVLTEGQQQQQRDGIGRASGAEAISCELKLPESGRTKTSLAKASKATHKRKAMERADISPSYTSDEWEADSINSDTDDDHTDSSDDDDPKSQVDRLIERGTLMYMDGENSALSSEDESDDSDDDDYDSESDITDVSPLISATASPLGLSPVLPRRTIPTSPLAIHDNRELTYTYDERQCPFNWDNVSPPESITDHQTEGSSEETTHDSSNMDLLLQAVIELENQNRREQFNLNNPHHNHHHQIDNSKISGLPNNPNDQMFIHPIRDNPHHNHLRKTCLRRKNMSFTNEEVRKIDRDNKILLKKIMAAHTRVKHETSPHYPTTRSYHKPSSSPANKRREEKIRRENFILLKKIQEAKPSKDVVSPIGTMDPLLAPVGVGSHALRSPTNSCGAFMRSIVQAPHVNVPAPRKETAL